MGSSWVEALLLEAQPAQCKSPSASGLTWMPRTPVRSDTWNAWDCSIK